MLGWLPLRGRSDERRSFRGSLLLVFADALPMTSTDCPVGSCSHVSGRRDLSVNNYCLLPVQNCCLDEFREAGGFGSRNPCPTVIAVTRPIDPYDGACDALEDRPEG
mgnify:CR=1 FL=1